MGKNTRKIGYMILEVTGVCWYIKIMYLIFLSVNTSLIFEEMVNCSWVSNTSDEKPQKVLAFVAILSKSKIFTECQDFLFGIRFPILKKLFYSYCSGSISHNSSGP